MGMLYQSTNHSILQKVEYDKHLWWDLPQVRNYVPKDSTWAKRGGDDEPYLP